MNGLMMDQPLLISTLLTHAERHHGEQEIVSRRVEGDVHRYTYRDLGQRAPPHGQRAGGIWHLVRCTVFATLAWNGYRHMELYYAVSGSGAVLHTLNPRLHPDQLVWIADHAEDRSCSSTSLLLRWWKSWRRACRTMKAFVAMTDRARMPSRSPLPNLLCYEDLLEAHAIGLRVALSSTSAPLPPSATPAARRATRRACCTAIAPRCCIPTGRPCPIRTTCPARDVVLPVVPMFHVNAWGFRIWRAWSAPSWCFPGRAGRQSLYELFESRGSHGLPAACRPSGKACWRTWSTRAGFNHVQLGPSWRRGLPAGHAALLPVRLRCRGAAWLGHDRNQPLRRRVSLKPAARWMMSPDELSWP